MIFFKLFVYKQYLPIFVKVWMGITKPNFCLYAAILGTRRVATKFFP